jgi:hypothetical protein
VCYTIGFMAPEFPKLGRGPASGVSERTHHRGRWTAGGDEQTRFWTEADVAGILKAAIGARRIVSAPNGNRNDNGSDSI